MRREKTVIVLEHLLLDMSVKTNDNRCFVLDGNNELCQAVETNGKKVLLPVLGVELGAFINFANGLNDDDIFIMSSETAMRKASLERQEGSTRRDVIASLLKDPKFQKPPDVYVTDILGICDVDSQLAEHVKTELARAERQFENELRQKGEYECQRLASRG